MHFRSCRFRIRRRLLGCRHLDLMFLLSRIVNDAIVNDVYRRTISRLKLALDEVEEAWRWPGERCGVSLRSGAVSAVRFARFASAVTTLSALHHFASRTIGRMNSSMQPLAVRHTLVVPPRLFQLGSCGGDEITRRYPPRNVARPRSTKRRTQGALSTPTRHGQPRTAMLILQATDNATLEFLCAGCIISVVAAEVVEGLRCRTQDPTSELHRLLRRSATGI